MHNKYLKSITYDNYFSKKLLEGLLNYIKNLYCKSIPTWCTGDSPGLRGESEKCFHFT
jgi:hypothetical protein